MIQSFIMALRSISANKMRAVLTMLGIIIGVMALVVLVSLVNGATGSITDAVSGLGSSLLTVTISDDKGEPISLEDMNSWMDEEEIGLVAPYQSDSVTARHGSESGMMTVYGTTPAYYDIQGLQLSMGRWLKNTDVDNHSYVCIINEAAAENLIGYTDCVGQTVSLDGVTCTVVGVLENNDDSLTAVITSGMMAAYIPYTSLPRLSDTVDGKITSFYVSAAEGSTLEVAEEAMDGILLERFEEDEDAYSISSQNVLEEAMESITGVLSVLLGGIAAISLIVGGIGIMNIMLVSVTERTREIGIRKSLGARRFDIMSQFVVEAATTSAIGGVIGIIIGMTVSYIAGNMLEIDVQPSVGAILLSFSFSAAIGILFGYFPARKAAKLNPIDALRHD